MVTKYRFNKLLFLSIIPALVIMIGCKNIKKQSDTGPVVSFEKNVEEILYRPDFHFTPKANWMNDPNGMFYLNGKYHLYFQYYPDGNVWGPMHWGHAISEDLITWNEQPIALYPDEKGYIFSGGAIVDHNNTSGFGKNGIVPIVAFFTYHNMDGEKEGTLDFQTQAIAYSLDEGMTWKKYEGNPVIPNPGIKDFRDPKVIWDSPNNKWILSLAAGDKIMFYSSPNLIEWEFESEFGEGVGAHGGVWECPDLFPIKVEDNEELKWVLLVSINPGGPNGGSATQYFVGDFNGKRFTLDKSFNNELISNEAIWLDYGRDNYAGVTWSNIPKTDGRKLFIGWMSNWDYARDVPTETWRSSMTAPRELKLVNVNGNYRLESLPITELNNYVSNTMYQDFLIKSKNKDIIITKKFNTSSLNIQFKMNDLKSEIYTFRFQNKEGDTLEIGLNNIENYFFIDRRKSGQVNFSEKFAPQISKANSNKALNALNIQILLDKTSIEVFYNDGETVMTELFFPNNPLDTFSIISKDKDLKIIDLKIQEFQFN